MHRGSDKCFPFKIKKSKEKGRYMVAVRDIPALDIILVERAAACGPKLVNTPVCVECLADVSVTGEDYIKCQQCHLPFCSEKCKSVKIMHTRQVRN